MMRICVLINFGLELKWLRSVKCDGTIYIPELSYAKNSYTCTVNQVEFTSEHLERGTLMKVANLTKMTSLVKVTPDLTTFP